MATLLKTICVTAGVCMSALAAAGAATAAQAGDLAVHIRIGDLNLNSVEGRAAFETRVDRAASTLCQDRRDLDSNAACRRDVRAEADAQLDTPAVRNGETLASARP